MNRELILKRAFLLSAVITFLPATANGINLGHRKLTNEQMQIARLMLETNSKAEDKLFEDMKTVALYLDKYVHQTKRLPEDFDEIEFFKQSASSLIPTNPYKEGEQAKEQPPNPHDAARDCDMLAVNPNLRVEVKLDYELSDEKVEAFQGQPPSSWKAEPGKICLITNGMNWAVIWGAGSNQMPIRSHENGKPLIITLKVR